MNDSTNQIKLGAILSYFTIAINILMGLLYTPWMIRTIGQSDYGIYGMGTSIIALLAMDFGVGRSVTRYIAWYQERNQEDKVNEVIGWALKLYFVIDCIITAVLFVVYFLLQDIYVSLSNDEISKLKIVFVIVGSYTVISFPFQVLNGVITAREKFVFQKVLDFVCKISTAAITGILLYMGKGLYALVLVNAVIGCLAAGAKLIFLKKKHLFKVSWKTDDLELKRGILSFSAWTIVILVCQRLTLNIIPSILGITSGTAQVAIFTPALNIEGYVYTLAGAVNGLLLTKVTRLFQEDTTGQRVEQLGIKYGKYQLFIVGAICAVFVSQGKEFVYLWLGDLFRDTYYVAVLLIIPFLVTATQEIANISLSVKGQLKYRSICYIFTAVFTFSVSLLLSSIYGAIGAAVGFFVGNIVGEIIVANIIYRRVLNMDISAFFIGCHGKMLVPILTTGGAGIVLNLWLNDWSWGLFLVKCIILVLFYFVMSWIFGFDEEDKNLIKNVLKSGG